MAPQSIDIINDLTHAISGLSHIEDSLFPNRLAIQKFKLEKEPIDVAFHEAETKVGVWEAEQNNLENWTWQWLLYKLTCGLEEEKKRTKIGLQKAKTLLSEKKEQVDVMDDKLRDLEQSNEKNEVDYRTLTKYREDLTKELDEILKEDWIGSEKELKTELDNIESSIKKVTDDDKKLDKVRELIKLTDMSILEAILELRQTNKENNLKKGQIYFPEIAYQSLKKARDLYPELPAIPAPEEYRNDADDTGAYYSPMQKYLWDVRKRLKYLLEWCDERVLVLMEEKAQKNIIFGKKWDEWNMERRRLVLDMNST
ncbi:unnamed protein product [Cunninghamella echinulata]